MRSIYKILLVLGLMGIIILFNAYPVYADPGCEGDDCDMEVDVTVSGNSEVGINTGSNCEVDVNPGPDNDVFINGQDINEPTVIHTTTTIDTSMSERQRITKLEHWRQDTNNNLQIVADGLAQLIVEFENGNGDYVTLSAEIADLQDQVNIVKTDLNKTNGVTGYVAEIDESQIALMAENQILRQELELMRLKSERDQRIYAYWIVGLTVGIAVMSSLLYHNSKRTRASQA